MAIMAGYTIYIQMEYDEHAHRCHDVIDFEATEFRLYVHLCTCVCV